MSWEDRARGFNIGKMYWDAHLENASLLPNKLLAFGRDWIKSSNKQSLYLSGVPGCGKTYFSVALLKGLFEKNEFGLFVKSGDLDLELLRAAREGDEFSVLRKYAETDVLFIDDFGVERDSDRMIRQWYFIIDSRIENNRPTIISSNRRKSEASLDPRIISRLELALELKFPTKDLRKGFQIQ
ncbi:MAG TPA: ATP-binding protein [Chlamydiales bacterium]|nr:ATP-binding protein [Chlamydiales bacterium]